MTTTALYVLGCGDLEIGVFQALDLSVSPRGLPIQSGSSVRCGNSPGLAGRSPPSTTAPLALPGLRR